MVLVLAFKATLSNPSLPFLHVVQAVGIVIVISSEEQTKIFKLHLELQDHCSDGLERVVVVVVVVVGDRESGDCNTMLTSKLTWMASEGKGDTPCD